jgi:hypothetical protein
MKEVTMMIMMTPEGKLELDLWYVLQKLKGYSLREGDPEHSPFLYSVEFDRAKNPPDAIPPTDEISLLKKLAETYKAIDIGGHEGTANPRGKIIAKFQEEIDSLEDNYATWVNDSRIRAFLVKIINPAFDKIYEKQRKKIRIYKTILNQPEVSNDKPLFDVPSGTKWEAITIKFKDEENIEVFLNDKHVAFASHKKMRFGKNRPDKRWRLLRTLAMIYMANEQRAGEKDMPATVDDLAYSMWNRVDGKAKTNLHTIKKSLASQLMEDFGIYDDPFDDYKRWGYHKTEFNLIAESSFRLVGKEGVWGAEKRLDAISYKTRMTDDKESTEDLQDDETLEDGEDEAEM